MKKKKLRITRRQALLTGASALGALLLPGCKQKTPPNYGSILRMGDNLTYLAHRTLLPGQSLAMEYQRSEISSFPATGTTNPGDPKSPYFSEAYRKLQANGFKDWALSLEGRLAKPKKYTLADLKNFPARTQVTRHTCEEGWTAIAEWTGVPLSLVLQDAGILPSARFVNFYGYDHPYMECVDLLDAFHPQTILAYGMNGQDLPLQHGAPLRGRVERQVGYKSVKYIERIVVTDEFVGTGDTGWSWYVGM
jgi:DMSO/TMAO reductase YedYZ molybdopterin-dependent catalytic subunit